MKEIVKIIQAKTGKNMEQVADSIGYSRGHISRLANDEDASEDSAAIEKLLEEKYSGILQNVIFAAGPAGNYTPEQLYAMFMRVTEMQTGILKSIESKMAQETTQAKIAANSLEILAGVRSLSKRQKQAIAQDRQEFQELKSQKGRQRQGSSKNPDRIDGANKKPGRKTA